MFHDMIIINFHLKTTSVCSCLHKNRTFVLYFSGNIRKIYIDIALQLKRYDSCENISNFSVF